MTINMRPTTGLKDSIEQRRAVHSFRSEPIPEAALHSCKEKEEELKRSEANLATAQKIAHLGNWEFDVLTGNIVSPSSVHPPCLD